MKNDRGKRDWTYLNPLFHGLEEVVKVLEFGAKKYSRDNWKTVEKSRYVKALWRHFVDYMSGEERDRETGYSHLAHMACCILFILEKEHGSDSGTD